MSAVSKKICLLGDFSVGKTSLIRQFVDRQFSDAYLSTVGVKISRKTLALDHSPEGASLQLIIWDIEGKTQFKGIAATYLQGAKAAILVADSTRPSSLTSLSEHLKLVRSVSADTLVAIALNKADLVSPEVAKMNQKNLDPALHQAAVAIAGTSAKTGLNVEALFLAIARPLR